MLSQIFDIALQESKHARSGYSVLAELFVYGFFFAKFLRILLSIEINANCRFCMISWF